MSLGYRLFGDLNVAASLRGEAKRLRFVLGQFLGHIGLDFGQIQRTYPDGSAIRVRKVIGGQEYIEITGTAPQGEQAELLIETFYLMVYWTPSVKKFYRAFRLDNRISVTELTRPLHPNIINAYSAMNAPLVLNDFRLDHHVVNYGIAHDNWLKIAPADTTLSRNHNDRFWYRRGKTDDWSDNHGLPYIQMRDFNANYSTQTAYFPKETNHAVAWTELNHGSYGAYQDIKGPFNYTLEANQDGIDRATSWGQRIVDLGYGPEEITMYGVQYPSLMSFYSQYVHSPDSPYLLESYCYQYAGDYFLWPVITTAWTRKRPRTYGLKYETDKGTQSTGILLTDSLILSGEAGDCRTVSHWPFAALYGQKILHIKNTQSRTGAVENATDTLLQELKAGEKVIDSASSKIVSTFEATTTYLVHTDIRIVTVTDSLSTLTGDYSFIDLLAFSEFKDFLFCFIKKTTVSLKGLHTGHRKADTSNIDVEAWDSLNLSVNKTVEYFLIAPGTRRLMATFSQSMNAVEDLNGVISASQDGLGKRIHGISCQANQKLCVFSCTEEEFTGLGDEASDYYFFAPNPALYFPGFYPEWPINWWGSVLPIQRIPVQVGAFKQPYPFPLEDQQTSLQGKTLWKNQKLIVGAVSQDVEGHGYFTYVENPGSVGQVKEEISGL